MSTQGGIEMTHLRKLSTALMAVMIMVLLTAVAPAQSTQTGDVTGTVTDPSGAVVPGASVTLKSLDTGGSQSTTTNQSGDFRFTLLKPGRYSVSATQTVF